MGYWTEREYKNMLLQKSNENLVVDNIKSLYDKTQKDIERQIRVFYERYAKDSGISISEAMRRVSKMDVEAFQDKARLLVETKDFSEEAHLQLKLYNATMKINRLELLKAEIGLDLLSTTGDVEGIMEKFLETSAIREYKRQAGILQSDIHYTKEAVKAVAKADYQYGNFSSNLWSNQQQLHANIGVMLRRSIIQGSHPETMISRLREQFNVTKYQASRLLITEASRVQGEVQIDAYKQAGFDKYRYIAEPKACKFCSALDDKVFDIRDRVVGVNFYPMHPNCRCSSSAYYEDDTLEDDIRSFERVNNGIAFENTENGGIIKSDNLIVNYHPADEKTLQNLSDEIYKKLNPKEREALSAYTQGLYTEINESLGNGGSSVYEDAINSAMDKFTIQENIITYRGANEKYYLNYKEGDIFESKIFYSTSIDKDQAAAFADDVEYMYEDGYKGILLEIKVPKNSKGIYIGNNTDYKDEGVTINERELLLSNKTRYRVEHKSEDRIILEVINDGDYGKN